MGEGVKVGVGVRVGGGVAVGEGVTVDVAVAVAVAVGVTVGAAGGWLLHAVTRTNNIELIWNHVRKPILPTPTLCLKTYPKSC